MAKKKNKATEVKAEVEQPKTEVKKKTVKKMVLVGHDKYGNPSYSAKEVEVEE